MTFFYTTGKNYTTLTTRIFDPKKVGAVLKETKEKKTRPFRPLGQNPGGIERPRKSTRKTARLASGSPACSSPRKRVSLTSQRCAQQLTTAALACRHRDNPSRQKHAANILPNPFPYVFTSPSTSRGRHRCSAAAPRHGSAAVAAAAVGARSPSLARARAPGLAARAPPAAPARVASQSPCL